MLVITNNCMGGYFYRDVMKISYNHPFFWGTMKCDILELIKNFDKIDFKNYKVEKDEKDKYSLIIDNLIKYKLIHHHLSPRDKVVRKNDHDVFYDKIEDYIKEKYESRLERMLDSKEKPTFAIHWFPSDGFKKKMLDDFIKNDIKYKTVIFMPYKEYKDYNKGNIILVYSPLSLTSKNSELAKKLKNFI